MLTYIHEEADWPRRRWRDKEWSASLADVCHRRSRLIGRMSALGFELQSEAVLPP
ncbi:MAG: DUF4172 domain-containing protein [Alphaproteobacteria bacterium]